MKKMSPLGKIFAIGAPIALAILGILNKDNQNMSENGIPFDKPEEKKEIKADVSVSHENDEDSYQFDTVLAEMKQIEETGSQLKEDGMVGYDIKKFEHPEGAQTTEELLRGAKEEITLTTNMKNSYHNNQINTPKN